jgi:hypothetical protein
MLRQPLRRPDCEPSQRACVSLGHGIDRHVRCARQGVACVPRRKAARRHVPCSAHATPDARHIRPDHTPRKSGDGVGETVVHAARTSRLGAAAAGGSGLARRRLDAAQGDAQGADHPCRARSGTLSPGQGRQPPMPGSGALETQRPPCQATRLVFPSWHPLSGMALTARAGSRWMPSTRDTMSDLRGHDVTVLDRVSERSRVLGRGMGPMACPRLPS